MEDASVIQKAAKLVARELHVFKQLGQWFAYGRFTGLVLRLEDQEGLVLKALESGLPCDLESTATRSLIASCAVKILERQVRRQEPTPPHSVQLIMTDACNLGCTYCYGMYYLNDPKSRMMSLQTVEDVLDFADMIGARDIGFFGGEPLANFKAIRHAVQYAMSKGYQFSYGMTTNATMISEDVAAFLADHKVAVSVSLDGDREMHDRSRVHKNGTGTYRQVVRGIKILKKRDALDLIEVTYSAHQERSVKEAVQAASEFSSCVSCTCVEGRGNACFSTEVVRGEKLKKYYRDMFDLFAEKSNSSSAMGGINELVANILSDVGFVKEHVCSALLSRVTVGIDGVVYPCPETMSAGFKVGHVTEFADSESFMNARNAALEGAKKKDVQTHWFANLTDICIARLYSDPATRRTHIDDAEAIGEALEEVIARTVMYAEKTQAVA